MRKPFELKILFNDYFVTIGINVELTGFNYQNKEKGFEELYSLDYVSTNKKNTNMTFSDIRNIIGDIGIKCRFPMKFDITYKRFIQMWEFHDN